VTAAWRGLCDETWERVHVKILVSHDAKYIEMEVHQPLLQVPMQIMLRTHGDRSHFLTRPPGHYLERTDGRYDYLRERAATGRPR
jgi:hypothetical protein